MLAAMALRTSVLSFIPHGQAQKLGDQVEEEERTAAQQPKVRYCVSCATFILDLYKQLTESVA